MLKILNKSTNSIKNNNSKNILIEKKNTLGKNNQNNMKKLFTQKRVTVNLK